MAILFGVLTGLALGLTGGGGSILAVPMLIYGLGLAPKAATSVSLAAVALIAAVGAGDAAKAQLLEIRAALLFAATGILAAPVGVAAAQTVTDSVIVAAFAGLMLVVGLHLFVGARGDPAHMHVVRAGLLLGAAPESGPVCRYSRDGRLRLTAPCSAALAAFGLVVGFLSGFFGVGGGFLIVPALLAVTGMGMRRAVATSLLVIVLIGASGVVSAYVAGRGIPWFVTGLFVLGGVAGMGFGRRLAAHIAGPVLQRLFAVFVVVVGLAMLVGYRFGLSPG